MADFDGKVALVTGAGSGIGRAVARHYAGGGCRVVVSDVDESAGRETVELISADAADARFVRADVSRAEECETLIGRTMEAFGGLDIACNNAGIGAHT